MSLNAVSSFILNQNQFILSIYLFLFSLVWFEFSFFRFFFSTISGRLTWPGQGSRINSRRKNLLTFPSKTKTTLQPFSTTIFALYKMLKCWRFSNVKKLKMLKSWKCWKAENVEKWTIMKSVVSSSFVANILRDVDGFRHILKSSVEISESFWFSSCNFTIWFLN